jgi:hypothetical protein
MFASPMIKSGEEGQAAMPSSSSVRPAVLHSAAEPLFLFSAAAKQQIQTSLRIRLGTKLATRDLRVVFLFM